MKIVIIDDEEVSLFLTQQMLINHGVTENIHSFLSAEEALNSIQTGGDEDVPDIVLLDLNMPIMNGWEFLDALKPEWEKLRKKSRIFILTTSLDFSDEEGAKSHPMVTGLMHKPMSIENVRLISQ